MLASPAGEGEAPFRLPGTPGEWLHLRSGLARSLRHLVPEEGSPASGAPWQTGEALFRALFSGQPGLLLAHSLGSSGERGLRLRLRFRLDTDDPRLALLHSLPWELLYKADSRDFLGLSRQTPIVRSLEVPRPVPALPLPSPLRILAVPALPEGTVHLDLDLERRNLEEAWAAHPDVEIVLLDKPGPSGLRQALLEAPFHVIHFMGHGEMDPATGRGVLFFAGVDGTRIRVSGESLAALLKDVRTVRLVFLNACESGRTPDGAEVDPFAGVATALVLGGIPAVVAMQLPVSDAAAIVFSRTVYERLAAGDLLDAAVAEGRLALYTEFPDSVEWAVPVLFSRIPDGRLFRRSGLTGSREIVRRTMQPALPALRRARRWLAGAAALLVATALAWLAVRNLDLLPGDVPPIEKVRVGSFRIARYEVSNEEYRQFVEANPEWRKGRVPSSFQDGDYLQHWRSSAQYPPGLEDHPVTFVSWFAAQAFCEWAGGSLPDQEKWREAAHTKERRYPWEEIRIDPDSPAPLNFCDASCELSHRGPADLPAFLDGYAETAPVDAFRNGQTSEGIFNLSGNVWEWALNVSGQKGVTLGGSFAASYEECSTDQVMVENDTRLCSKEGGFRCIWD